MIEYKVTVDTDGTRKWYNTKGQLHREDGPAVEYPNGTKSWYIGGKPHREDGPAIEYPDGRKRWYVRGELHREDGPAVEFGSGDKRWYIRGEKLTEKEFNQRRNTCNGKIVEIEGKQYELKLIQ